MRLLEGIEPFDSFADVNSLTAFGPATRSLGAIPRCLWHLGPSEEH